MNAIKRGKGKLKNRIRQERYKKIACFVFSYLILFAIIVSLAYSNQKLNNELEKKEQHYTEVINEKDTRIQALNDNVEDLAVTIQDLDLQLTSVSEVNQSYVDELNMFREREELYNKYEYAIIDAGRRTKLTYEEIKLGEDLMVENGRNPHLMFGSIMVESNANPDVVNSQSGATGYGQFLNSTAEYVWEDIMGNSGYYPDLRKDGEANIKMMASYYEHLYGLKGSTFNVIKHYSGNSTNEGTQRYIDRINRYTSKVGVYIN